MYQWRERTETHQGKIVVLLCTQDIVLLYTLVIGIIVVVKCRLTKEGGGGVTLSYFTFFFTHSCPSSFALHIYGVRWEGSIARVHS